MSRLIVCVPGLRKPFSTWEPLISKLRQEPDWQTDTDLQPFEHGSTAFSLGSASQLARNLAAKIESDWITNGKVTEVILIGHSMGALLVRQAYLMSLPQGGKPGKPWAGQVTRIVLLSGINRGLQLSRSLRALLPVLLPGKFLVKDLLSGSDYVTNLRIWWIRKLARLEVRPVVVQIRGGQDALVKQEDSIDIEGFLEGHEMLVESAGHGDLLLPDDGDTFTESKYRILRHAILRPFPNEQSAMRVEDGEKKIFFVVHGIRDNNNDWVNSVKDLIEKAIPSAYVVTPYLGRFSSLHFLIPPVRRTNVRKFQDWYSTLLSKNPLAKFYFVGHSYGTYVLGHSLHSLSGIEFERVFLAGSVLPESWSWTNHPNQVKELRNCRAQFDYPVAVLCKALRAIGLGEGIGVAGYSGFSIPFDPQSEQFYYPGGHSAPIQGEVCRADIVGFLESGSSFKPTFLRVKENSYFRALHNLSPLIGYLILLMWGALVFAAAQSSAHTERHLAEAVLIPLFVGALFLYFY